jgi:hypothetical protein
LGKCHHALLVPRKIKIISVSDASR